MGISKDEFGKARALTSVGTLAGGWHVLVHTDQ
jgi:hypothetical protein